MLIYMNPITFNHVSKDFTDDKIDGLKRLYCFYH